MKIAHPKTDPLLSSSMQQAAWKYDTPRLELKSSATFAAIKRCLRTKNGEVISLAQSLLKRWSHIYATIGVKLLYINVINVNIHTLYDTCLIKLTYLATLYSLHGTAPTQRIRPVLSQNANVYTFKDVILAGIEIVPENPSCNRKTFLWGWCKFCTTVKNQSHAEQNWWVGRLAALWRKGWMQIVMSRCSLPLLLWQLMPRAPCTPLPIALVGIPAAGKAAGGGAAAWQWCHQGKAIPTTCLMPEEATVPSRTM